MKRKTVLMGLSLAVGLLFAGAKTPSEAEMEEYLTFLYGHISLPDSVDYSRDFYRQNIATALEARAEMPWGQKVPEREFRHFVLPVRVNNEDLDTSRTAFYRELRDRVKDMSMTDAAQEVNHWCHEKVTYRPSDGRTLSPLNCVKTAWGRCGEESTFTVAAMRSVGIPARQVYTPRWAHTDDNHAWVEVWTDGQWHFLGACEPAPLLDLAWFNAPAARGMMMATNVFGRYDGPEEVLLERPLDTRINITSNYAPVDTLTIRVTDPSGRAVEGAKVDFTLYNYSEFYPLVTRTTGADGLASVTAGLGDMLVWASDPQGRFGFQKVTVGGDDEPLSVVLDKDATLRGGFDFNLVPPRGGAKIPQPSPRQADENARRLAFEDSIRGAYMASFFTPEKAREFAVSNGYDADVMGRALPGAHGNHATITRFLSSRKPQEKAAAQQLVAGLAPKDLCDVSEEVLLDALNAWQAMFKPEDVENVLLADYVLQPRVASERLTPYRAFFASHPEIPSEPQALRRWLADNLTLDSDFSLNPSHNRLSPEGVYGHRRNIDPNSRDAFFVSRLRSVGKPSRIDPVTGRTQWHNGQEWVSVDFEEAAISAPLPTKKGFLQLTFNPESVPFSPRYYSHFTIAKIGDDGCPSTLGFPELEEWDKIFGEPVEMEAGQYMLLSGQRMASGEVLAHADFFAIEPGRTTQQPLSIRQAQEGLEVIGSFDSETLFEPRGEAPKSYLAENGRGYFVVGLMAPNNEPTVHALNDIQTVTSQLQEAFPGKIFLIYPSQEALERAGLENFPSLPTNVVIGTDAEGLTARQLRDNLKADTSDTPVFIIADTFNRVVFLSQGYTIGLGEKLATALKQLNE